MLAKVLWKGEPQSTGFDVKAIKFPFQFCRQLHVIHLLGRKVACDDKRNVRRSLQGFGPVQRVGQTAEVTERSFILCKFRGADRRGHVGVHAGVAGRNCRKSGDHAGMGGYLRLK